MTTTPPARVGRPSIYNPEMSQRICDHLAAGGTMTGLAKIDGMPNPDTVYDWIKKYPEFSEAYRRAREIAYLNMADQLVEIADKGGPEWEGMPETARPETTRIQIETRKWLLSKCLPKIYGNQTAVEISGPNGGPIEVENARDKILARLANLPVASTEDADS